MASKNYLAQLVALFKSGGGASFTGTVTATGTVGIDQTTPGTTDSVTVKASAGIGSLTETPPATDTASSGLNGRAARIAQRITSLIALLPAAIGAAAKAGSLSIAFATDQAMQQFNGTSYEEVRGNVSGTVLASALRAAAAAAVPITNYNKTSLYVFLNVTAASGTGGLSVQVRAVDPVSGALKQLNAAPTAVTATGLTTYFFNSGTISASGVTQGTNCHVPRDLNILVTHGDGSNYTYSVGYSLQ